MRILKTALWSSAALIGLALVVTAPAAADQVFLDDIIVDGSACIGFDCVNGESFGFDTIRIKENNLRIKAQDTSTAASFPDNVWQITFNDSSNGGQDKFAIDDISGGRTPFTIEAGAPSHSLYVDDGGRIGFGTNTPVVDLHVKSGNTPTLRLEQDGSSGFSPQTWDVAGNEANFFIRDATNGSTLPLRIFPNAPSNALTIEAGGQIGLGTTSPLGGFHVENTSGDDEDDFVVTDDGDVGIGTTAPAQELDIVGAAPQVRLQDTTDTADFWVYGLNGSEDFIFNFQGAATPELRITQAGALVVNGTTLTVPDYVFEPGYRLMPLSELEAFVAREKHLPNVPSKTEINLQGLDLREMPLRLLEKVEELTLYTLAQERRLQELVGENAALAERVAALAEAQQQ